MKLVAYLIICGLQVRVWAGSEDPAQVIFTHATRALQAGDYVLAEQGFLAVLKQEPNNLGAIGNLGILYARSNRTDKAIVQYRRVLQLSPDDEPILVNLGIVYLKQELHAQALPYFARAVKINARNQQARQLLDVCRLYTGEVTPALQDLEELRTTDPHNEQLLFLIGFAYLKGGDSKMAVALFNQMFEAADPAHAQFMLGRASYEAALFPQAEESFSQVQRVQPDYPGLHLELGKLYISERRTEDATRELKLALRENAANEDANYFLGSLFVQESRESEGLSYLMQAAKLKPDSWATYFYLGKAELHMNQPAQAVTWLRKAVALNPDDGNAQYQLGRALQAAGQKAAASQAFARAHELKAEARAEVKIPGVR